MVIYKQECPEMSDYYHDDIYDCSVDDFLPLHMLFDALVVLTSQYNVNYLHMAREINISFKCPGELIIAQFACNIYMYT